MTKAIDYKKQPSTVKLVFAFLTLFFSFQLLLAPLTSAASYCDQKYNGASKTACDKGSTAGKGGISEDVACKGLKGNAKNACEVGYDKGAKQGPKSSGTASGDGIDCGAAGVCDTDLPDATASNGQLKNLLQIAIGVLGALAVLMIVLSGLRMVTAQGDSGQIAKGRNGILYAVVGVLIAIVAESIVSLVLSNV